MSFRVIFVTLFAAVVLLLTASGASGTTTTTEPLPEVPNGVNSIIGVAPGQGVEPQASGDRGGSAQVALFFVIVAALGAIGLLVRRDIRRARSRSRTDAD